jgi:hypothetical protein
MSLKHQKGKGQKGLNLSDIILNLSKSKGHTIKLKKVRVGKTLVFKGFQPKYICKRSVWKDSERVKYE